MTLNCLHRVIYLPHLGANDLSCWSIVKQQLTRAVLFYYRRTPSFRLKVMYIWSFGDDSWNKVIATTVITPLNDPTYLFGLRLLILVFSKSSTWHNYAASPCVLNRASLTDFASLQPFGWNLKVGLSDSSVWRVWVDVGRWGQSHLSSLPVRSYRLPVDTCSLSFTVF